jgi:hypothetical protein
MRILITGVISGVSYGIDEKQHVFLLDATTGKPVAQIEGAVAEQVRKTFALAEKYEPPKP